MTLSWNPPDWGDENFAVNYTLYMEGSTPITQPIDLTGHGLSGFGEETTDALEFNYNVRVRGENRVKTKVIRPAEVTKRTFTITMGQGGKIWTPAMQRARQGGSNCRTTFWAVRNCPTDPRYGHAFCYPDSIIGPLTRPNDLITVGENGEPATLQSECSTTEELLIYSVGLVEKNTVTDVKMYGVAFIEGNCASCEDTAYSTLIAVGGDGSAVPVCRRTTDRFANVTTVSMAAASAGEIANCVATDNDIVMIGVSDDVLASATSGNIYYSTDGCTTAPLAATLPASPKPIWSIANFKGIYVAVGGATGGQATIYTSTDAVNWEALSSASLPADKALLGVAADSDKGTFYVVGESGTCLKGEINAGSIVLTALTVTGVSTEDLYAVAVLHEDHIAVGGTTGFYAESWDGGVTWTSPAMGGTTDTIYAIAGDKQRSVVGAGNTVYKRDVLTNFIYEAMTVENGLTTTGDIRTITKALDEYEGFNYFAAVTDAASGELYAIQPYHPNA